MMPLKPLLPIAALISLAVIAAAQTPAPPMKPPGAATASAGSAAVKPPVIKPMKPARGFLVAHRTALWRGSLEVNNVGVNVPDLFERFLANDDASAVQSLHEARLAGAILARCFGTTWGPDQFGLFETDRARWLAAYDRMLKAADAEGIGIVPSLLFNIRMIPQYVQQKTGRDDGVVGCLTPGTASNDLAVAYVTAIVARYRADPRVLFWEIGNEYNLEADLSEQQKARPANDIPTSDNVHAFLVQIGTLIKKLDRKHMVTSGNADMRTSSWHLRQAMLAHKGEQDPNNYPMDWTRDTFDQYREILEFFNPRPLDIISSHLYPPDPKNLEGDTPQWLLPDATRAMRVSWTRSASELIGRPLFVGEFGEQVYVNGKEQPAVWTQDFFARLQSGVAPVSAIWAWEFRQNEALTPFSLSPAGTPILAQLLAATNHALLVELIGTDPALSPIPK